MKKHMKKEAGGLVEAKKSKVDYRTPSGDNTIKEADSTKESFKKGGAMKKHAKGGHVEGKKAHMRMDKRARGGGVMSKASSVSGRPGGKYDGGTDREDD